MSESFLSAFWQCFVPLFIAVDALGTLPIYIGLTEGIDPARQRSIIVQSVLTAALAALVFLVAGAWLLGMLGVTVDDFMIAGGVLLFVIAMGDLLTSTKTQRAVDPEHLGAVPLGMPLITGPAVLTTSILLSHAYGPYLTGLAIVTNVLIAGAVYWHAERLHAVLGKAGAKILSKMASMLLAAIAVMMIRKGVMTFAHILIGDG